MPSLKSDLFISRETKIGVLDCKNAFEKLEPREKLYTHYLAQASWAGDLISSAQSSAESPVLVSLFIQFFKSVGGVEKARMLAKENGFTEEEVESLLFYVGALLSNCGNYRSFGDTKFIPEVAKEKLTALLLASNSEEIKSIWQQVADLTYEVENPRCETLGFSPDGISTYFSYNCTEKDGNLVKRFLKSIGVEGWNTRCFKTLEKDGKAKYEVRFASAKKTSENDIVDGNTLLKEHEFEGAKFVITRGDYSENLEKMCAYLEKALEHASNFNEKEMIKLYKTHFNEGDVLHHKNASRHWIRNKGPIVETYIGFIETYRDPTGQRAEFEGFVSIVDKEKSSRLGKLVDNAEAIITNLPWGADYEKAYLRPDFTELDVVAFSGGSMPIGINIPNYSDIRQNEGFKNVSLGNVISAVLSSRPAQFISDEDHALLDNHKAHTLDIQVAIHELLGHGTGKLFVKKNDGSFNFNNQSVKHLLTGELIQSHYEEGETYDAKFGDISSSYEECRAEAVAIYLSTEESVLDVWGFKPNENGGVSDIVYAIWLSMAISGVKSLPFFLPKQNKWGQAHAQGRFAILRALEECGLVQVKVVKDKDGKDDLLLTMDRSKILSHGKEAMSTFLKKLQVYKSTADYEGGKAFYDFYTLFPQDRYEEMLQWHNIANEKKLPRPIIIQPNTKLTSDGKDVVYKSYNASVDDVIESYLDRSDDGLLKAAIEQYRKDKQHYKL